MRNPDRLLMQIERTAREKRWYLPDKERLAVRINMALSRRSAVILFERELPNSSNMLV